jgi:hypothetical protein
VGLLGAIAFVSELVVWSPPTVERRVRLREEPVVVVQLAEVDLLERSVDRLRVAHARVFAEDGARELPPRAEEVLHMAAGEAQEVHHASVLCNLDVGFLVFHDVLGVQDGVDGDLRLPLKLGPGVCSRLLELLLDLDALPLQEFRVDPMVGVVGGADELLAEAGALVVVGLFS